MQDNVKKSSDKNVRRDRFIRIAEYRVNKILDCLDNLGKCSNKRNYAYSGDEVRSIFKEIENKVKETKILFQNHSKNKRRFVLER